MKCKVQTNDIASALAVVTRAVSTKAINPIQTCVLLEAEDNGLTLTGSGGAMSIRVSIPAMVSESGSVAADGGMLAALARKLPAAETNMEASCGTLRVRSGSSRTNLAAHSGDEYPPAITAKGGTEVTVKSGTLKRSISQVIYCVAQDETRQILTGILMDASGDGIKMVALDGFRMAEAVTDGFFSECRAVVPGPSAKELERILPDTDEDVTVTVGSGRMTADCGGVVFSTTLLAGDYIDYAKLIPADFATRTMADRSDLLKAIDRAELMARNVHNNLVQLTVSDETVSITARSEVADTEETVACQTSGKGLTIAFNVKYLADAIKAMDGDEIEMCFNTSTSPAVLRCPGHGAMSLILPVRVA